MSTFDLVQELGFRVLDEEDDDPVLLRADGTPIDTWREGYPYGERLPREVYERDKRLLQIELLKLQYWVKRSQQKLVVVFPPPKSSNTASPPTASSQPSDRGPDCAASSTERAALQATLQLRGQPLG